MSDLISRQAAIDAVTSWLNIARCPINQSKYNEGEIAAYETAVSELEKVPPAQPKHGQWIHGREVSRDYIGDLCVQINYDEKWWCSECNYPVDDRPLWKFCPNCGASMSMDKVQE